MVDIIKRVEALVFASGEAISYKKLQNVLDITYDEVKKAATIIAEKYSQADSAIELIEVNSSIQFVVKSEFSFYVDKLFEVDSSKFLSKPELEVLSIIAYKQPVTRREIYNIRGINSSRIVNTLVELSLVKSSGHRESAGLPTLYVTTDTFLKKFGLSSLKDLPKIEDSENKLDLLFD